MSLLLITIKSRWGELLLSCAFPSCPDQTQTTLPTPTFWICWLLPTASSTLRPPRGLKQLEGANIRNPISRPET